MINAANIAVGYHCQTVIHLYNGSQNRCRQKAIQPLQRFQPFETSLMRLLQAHLKLDLLQGIAERMACGHVDGHTPKQPRHIRYRQRFARGGVIRAQIRRTRQHHRAQALLLGNHLRIGGKQRIVESDMRTPGFIMQTLKFRQSEPLADT